MAKGRTVPSRRRIRTLKAEFWTDPDMARFSLRCRHVYAGLICAYVDDFGRELDDLRNIKAAVWPQDDDVTLDDIAEDLTTLSIAGKIIRYDDTTSGQRGLRRSPAENHVQSRQRYLFLANWKKHQRVDKPTPSKYPSPPANSRITREQSRLVLESPAPELELELELEKEKEVGIGGGARGGGEKAKVKGRSQATKPNPEDNGEPPPKSAGDQLRERIEAHHVVGATRKGVRR